MNQEIKSVLNIVNIELDDNNKLYEQVISREIFLSDSKYNEIKLFIPDLKKSFSSTFMTSLQNNAEKQQKWPLLNNRYQVLSLHGKGGFSEIYKVVDLETEKFKILKLHKLQDDWYRATYQQRAQRYS